MMNICMFMLESNLEENGFNNDVLMTMSDTEYLSYPSDLTSMRIAQLNDESLMLIVWSYIASSGPTNTLYTYYKYVEGVELTHKNNRIMVPKSKQQSVLDWYHTICIGTSRNK